jgi:serine/threonine-protein kinase
MTGLKRLIQEIHRRSLWQVLGIYVVGAWIAFQVTQTLTEGLGLPEWFPPLALVLLIVGLPIVLATAFVQEGVRAVDRGEVTPLPGADASAAGERASAQERAGARRLFTWRNAISGGVAAFALWGVVAAGFLVFRGTGASRASLPDVDVAHNRIAVLPFSYRGGEAFAYLGEGIVDLLSATLDGAGELHSVDARSVIRAVERHGEGAPDPELGRVIAEGLGAGKYVVGDIVEVGSQIRVNGFLQSVEGREPLSRAAAEGAADQVFELVDDLTAQLLVGAVEGPAGLQARLAAVTTDSLAALKAYLEGAREDRAQRFSSAVEAFQRAVRIDPDFALAYRGLEMAASWTEQRDLQLEAGEHVQRLSSRLPERERRFLEAVATGGNAWNLLPEYLDSYPSDGRAWFQLGDVAFHLGPIKGREFTEARSAFERAISLDPEDADALYHLAAIAAWEGRREALDSLTRRVFELAPEGEFTYQMLALRAFALEDSAARQRLDDWLPQAGSEWIAGITKYIGVYSHSVDGALEPVRQLTDPSRPGVWRGYGHLVLAHLEAARGRWRASESEFEQAARLITDHAIEYRAHLAVAPFLTPAAVDLEAVRAQLLAWDASNVAPLAGVGGYLNTNDELHPHIRLYLLGLVSARLGLYEEAVRNAEELESSERPPRGSYLVPDFARTVRAQVALERGDIESALALLEALNLEPQWGGTYRSPFFTQLHTRYLLAEVLLAAGRDEEALRWFASLGGTSSFALSYVAPAHRRRAEIYDRMGQSEQAAHHYHRFIALWENCDPELRPLVDEAELQLARLTGERAAP